MFKEYRVEIVTSDGRSPSSMRFTARDAAGAIKQARSYMRDVCGYGRMEGPVKYRAVVTV